MNTQNLTKEILDDTKLALAQHSTFMTTATVAQTLELIVDQISWRVIQATTFATLDVLTLES